MSPRGVQGRAWYLHIRNLNRNPEDAMHHQTRLMRKGIREYYTRVD